MKPAVLILSLCVYIPSQGLLRKVNIFYTHFIMNKLSLARAVQQTASLTHYSDHDLLPISLKRSNG